MKTDDHKQGDHDLFLKGSGLDLTGDRSRNEEIRKTGAGERETGRKFLLDDEPAAAPKTGKIYNPGYDPAPVPETGEGEIGRKFVFGNDPASGPEANERNSYKFAPAPDGGPKNKGASRGKTTPPRPPKKPIWPWLAAAGAVLVIVGVISAARLSVHPRADASTVRSSMNELAVIADSFRDPTGQVPAERTQEAIDTVYSSAVGMPGVVACSKDEYGVYIEVQEGLDYVYTPETSGMDQGDGALNIITMQPYYTENKRKDSSFDHDGLDICAAETMERDARWSFAGRDNVDDSSVSLDRILALDDYKMILWHGHGGYNKTAGYYLCTTIKVTDDLLRRYPCLTKENAVIELGGKLGLKAKFFDDNFAAGSFDNAFIYLATCYSGKSTELARILVNKGAAVVFVNSESINRGYNLNMLHMIVESFCVGVNGPTVSSAIRSLRGYSFNSPENWTIDDSLVLAQVMYGNKDPNTVINRAEVFYVGGSDVGRLTYAAWMSRFKDTGEESPAFLRPDALFDYTYWDVMFGSTIGTQYIGQFRPDGTFTLVNWNRDVIVGTYTYDGGLLTLSADAFNGSISFEYIVGREDIYLPDVGTTLTGSGGDGFYSIHTHSSMGTSEEYTYYMHEKGDSSVYDEWMARAQEPETLPEDSLAGTYTSDETSIRLVLTENGDGSYHVRLEEIWADDWYLEYDAFADHGQFVIDVGNSMGDTIWIARYGDGMYVEVPEFVEARTNRHITGYYYPGASSAPAVTDLSGDNIDIRLYRRGLTHSSDGVLAEVDLLGLVEFDDAYVDSLQPGDVIPLSRYGRDDLYIETIGRFDWGIELSDGYVLMRLNNPDRWMLEDSRDDFWGIQYVTGSATILFPPGVEIIDQLITMGLGASPEELDSITDFFARADSYGYYTEREPATVSLDHGVVTSALIPYHP